MGIDWIDHIDQSQAEIPWWISQCAGVPRQESSRCGKPPNKARAGSSDTCLVEIDVEEISFRREGLSYSGAVWSCWDTPHRGGGGRKCGLSFLTRRNLVDYMAYEQLKPLSAGKYRAISEAIEQTAHRRKQPAVVKSKQFISSTNNRPRATTISCGRDKHARVPCSQSDSHLSHQ